MSGLIASIGRMIASVGGMVAVEIAARVAVKITSRVAVKITAEIVPHVLRHVHIEHVAAKPDQSQEELDDQHGPADGGTDNEYGSHPFNPQIAGNQQGHS